MKNTQNKETPRKEDVNRGTSIIFMQLGLVLALLLAYIAIESKTLVDDKIYEDSIAKYDIDEEFIPETTHKKSIPDKPKPKPEPILDKIKIEKNDANVIETVIGNTEPDNITPTLIDFDSIPEMDIPEIDNEDVPFKIIEDAPIFPGCKGSKKKIKKCFSDKVGKVVAKNFDVDLAQDLGLSSGIKKIRVYFTVDKHGEIADIIIRAPHKRLEKEAHRIVDLLPKMTPGKQRGRPVGVKFELPIVFAVE